MQTDFVKARSFCATHRVVAQNDRFWLSNQSKQHQQVGTEKPRVMFINAYLLISVD